MLLFGNLVVFCVYFVPPSSGDFYVMFWVMFMHETVEQPTLFLCVCWVFKNEGVRESNVI